VGREMGWEETLGERVEMGRKSSRPVVSGCSSAQSTQFSSRVRFFGENSVRRLECMLLLSSVEGTNC